MATTKPRITVTLEQEHYDVLAEFAKTQGVSMSAALAEVWAEAVPVITRVIKLIREAEAAKASVGDRVKELAVEAELEMLPFAREALKTLDMFDDKVMSAIKSARAAEGGGGAPTTPTSAASGTPQKRGKRK